MKNKIIVKGAIVLALAAPVMQPVQGYGIAAQEEEEVQTITGYDIAELAVRYSNPRQEQSIGNRGTALYQQLHDQVFPNDPYYGSCDRSISTAIVASGADPDFPPGPCSSIDIHCQNSDKWEYLGTIQEVSYNSLEPGDIFVMPSYHVMMYVGTELVQRIHGANALPNSDTVEGALCFNQSPATHFSVQWTYQTGSYNGYIPKIYRYRAEGMAKKEIPYPVQEQAEASEPRQTEQTEQTEQAEQIITEQAEQEIALKDPEPEKKEEEEVKQEEKEVKQKEEEDLVMQEVLKTTSNTRSKVLAKITQEVQKDVRAKTQEIAEKEQRALEQKSLLYLLSMMFG